jgi:hypothetical protein
MPPVGFKPMIPASARPKAHALDRAASGIGGELSLVGLIALSILCVPEIALRL